MVLLLAVWLLQLLTIACGIATVASIALRMKRRMNRQGSGVIVGFFHPYCNAGGGGERVLWKAISTLLEQGKCSVVVYSGDVNSTPADILDKVKQRFDIEIPVEKIQFVFLTTRWLVEASLYPRFTMLGQSAGSVILGLEALIRCTPDVWFDSMGYAFTYPISKFVAGCRIMAYVHYPTISTDMLSAVVENRPSVASRIATMLSEGKSFPSSTDISHEPPKISQCPFASRMSQGSTANLSASKCPFASRFSQTSVPNSSESEGLNNNVNLENQHSRSSKAKVIYYRLFAWLYGIVGRCCDCTLVNSTWTRNHIADLWSCDPIVLYPPCPVHVFKERAKNRTRDGLNKDRVFKLLSLAQFRPEKDHVLQIQAVNILVHNYGLKNLQLTMIGGCRGDQDEKLVSELRMMCKKCNLDDVIKFEVNAPYETVLEQLASADIGLHTMWNEHFGIGVVEMMAAGVVTIAHNSGGPKSDIIVQPSPDALHQTGFLATSATEYADAIASIVSQKVDCNAIAENAGKSVERFSDEEFQRQFKAIITGYIIGGST